MKISDRLRECAGRRPVFSFEFFPPKTEKGEESLFRVIGELKELSPDFVSVTYGAGGSTRDKTIGWVDRIKNKIGIEAMAHLTCVGAPRDYIGGVVRELGERGIENILALRGDPPRGESLFVPVDGGFRYANELVAFIRGMKVSMAVGVAGSPEKHLEAPDMPTDMRNLRRKVSVGADFVITQLFLNNAHYFDFLTGIRETACDEFGRWSTPVIPGIMPITAKNQIEKFAEMMGSKAPAELQGKIRRAASDDEAVEIGVAHALDQCRGLLRGGAPGIHFYTLNKSGATRRILLQLREEIASGELRLPVS